MRTSSAEERLRIGGLEGRHALTFVGGLAVTKDAVFVAQGQESLVRVFGKDGALLREIGGRGGGPGEFVGVNQIAIMDGKLIVTDAGQDRITWFDLDGSVVATRRYPTMPPAEPPLHWGHTRSYYAAGSHFIMATSTAYYDTEKVEAFPSVIATADGEVLDTLPGLYHRGGQRVLAGTVFLSPIHWSTRWSISQNGRYYAVADGDEDGVTVHVYDVLTLRGWELRVPVPARQVPQAYADSLARQYQESMSRTPVGQLPFARFKRELDLPATAVGVEHLQVMEDGTAWFSEPNFGGSERVWHAVNPITGTRERVIAPGDVVILFARGREMWGRAMDGFGVHYVVRLELNRPGLPEAPTLERLES